MKNPKKISELNYDGSKDILSGKLLFADITYGGYRYFGYIQRYYINGYTYEGPTKVIAMCPITLVLWGSAGEYKPQSIVYWNCYNSLELQTVSKYSEKSVDSWSDPIFNNIYAGDRPD